MDEAGNLDVADSDNDAIRKGSLAFRLTRSGFTNRRFRWPLTGSAGLKVVNSTSTNLRTWLPLMTNFLNGGSLNFADKLATNDLIGLFRARLKWKAGRKSAP